MTADLDNLLAEQDGLLTLTQAAQVLTPAALRHRIRPGGPWQRVLPGIYASFTGELAPRQRQRSALLHVGRDGMLCGTTALALAGLRYAPTDPNVHVMSPHEARVRSRNFVRVHRSTRPPRALRHDGFPVAPVHRAAIDACRELTRLADVRALLAETVQRGFTTLDRLEAELAAGHSAGSRLPRQALDDLRAGCRSAPECEARDLVRLSRILPEPEWNSPISDTRGILIGIADGWWKDVRMALEVNSREHHLYGETWEATMARHARFAAEGILVIPVSPLRIRRDGRAFLRQLERAYTARKGTTAHLLAG